MAHPTAKLEDDNTGDVDAVSDEVHDSTSVEETTKENTISPKLNLRSRIVSYTYSPGKVASTSIREMPPSTQEPLIPNRRKRSADTISTSTTNRPKRRETSSAASPSPAKTPPPRPKSTKRSSNRKALRATDPYSPTNNLVDSIRPGLMLLMIGLNPGLKTAETGHAYAHPSNLFWKLMHSSGLTGRRHLPSETRDLMDLYSIGNTNLCLRPTRDGSGLSNEELEAGVPVLEEKVRAHRPEVVCIVGKGIWQTIVKVKAKDGAKKPAKKDFNYGWQDESLWLGREVNGNGGVLWAGARTFVTTSTSGLAANTKPEEKAAIWKELGEWIVAKRARDIVKVEGTDGTKVKDEVAGDLPEQTRH